MYICTLHMYVQDLDDTFLGSSYFTEEYIDRSLGEEILWVSLHEPVRLILSLHNQNNMHCGMNRSGLLGGNRTLSGYGSAR